MKEIELQDPVLLGVPIISSRTYLHMRTVSRTLDAT